MTTVYHVAVIQMRSGVDKTENLARAKDLIKRAVAERAEFVGLPETFNCLGTYSNMASSAETIPGETTDWMTSLAKENGIYILGGSIYEKSKSAKGVYNTSVVISPSGTIVAKYRKVHLFDVDLPGDFSSSESTWVTPGDKLVVSETALGKIGLSVCYDLRFPELYRQLSNQGAQIICVPSAFRRTTGAVHWEVLLRARAIENQCYVLAPNQWGEFQENQCNYGHSMIVNPWGEIIAQAENNKDSVLTAEIDLMDLKKIRTHLPALNHRQIDRS